VSKQTLILVLCTVVILATVLAVIFRYGFPQPYAYSGTPFYSSRLEILEERLEALEQRIAQLSSIGPGFGRDVPAGTEEAQPTGTAQAESSSAIAQLRGALQDIERRVRALEQDPINRGYAYLSSQSPELRRRGIKALLEVARFDSTAREAIRSMLQDPDPSVRDDAADAIGRLNDKEAVPMLLQLLNDPSEDVRHEAIQNLCRLGVREAAVPIAKLLGDSSPKVREEAADALGRLRATETAPALIQALNDKNEGVRGEVIAALGEIKAREAVPYLRRIYDTDPGPHRIRLIRALQSLGDSEPLNREVQRLSETALNAENARARERAIEMLGWLAREQARSVFEKALEDPDPRIRRRAERILRRR